MLYIALGPKAGDVGTIRAKKRAPQASIYLVDGPRDPQLYIYRNPVYELLLASDQGLPLASFAPLRDL